MTKEERTEQLLIEWAELKKQNAPSVPPKTDYVIGKSQKEIQILEELIELGHARIEGEPEDNTQLIENRKRLLWRLS